MAVTAVLVARAVMVVWAVPVPRWAVMVLVVPAVMVDPVVRVQMAMLESMVMQRLSMVVRA